MARAAVELARRVGALGGGAGFRSSAINYWVQCVGVMDVQAGRQRHVLMLWTQKSCANGLDSLHVGEHPSFLLHSPFQVHCRRSRGSEEIKAG